MFIYVSMFIYVFMYICGIEWLKSTFLAVISRFCMFLPRRIPRFLSGHRPQEPGPADTVECRACPAGLKSQRFADNSGAEVEKMLGDEWWITMVSGCLWMVSGCLWMFLDV